MWICAWYVYLCICIVYLLCLCVFVFSVDVDVYVCIYAYMVCVCVSACECMCLCGVGVMSDVMCVLQEFFWNKLSDSMRVGEGRCYCQTEARIAPRFSLYSLFML